MSITEELDDPLVSQSVRRVVIEGEIYVSLQDLIFLCDYCKSSDLGAHDINALCLLKMALSYLRSMIKI